MLDAIYAGDVATRILKAHGLSTVPPPRAPARDPPQGELWDCSAPTDSAQAPAPPFMVSLSNHDFDQRSPLEDLDQTDRSAA